MIYTGTYTCIKIFANDLFPLQVNQNLRSTSKQYLKISDDYTRFILISFKTFWQLIVYFNYFEDVSTSHA